MTPEEAPPGLPGRARHGADHGRRASARGRSTGSTRACSSPSSPGTRPPAPTLYNQKDKDKARRLLKEAGYARPAASAGSPRASTSSCTRTRWWPSSSSRRSASSVDLQVVDWATLEPPHRKSPSCGTCSPPASSSPPIPANHVALRCNCPGWWCNEEKERLLAELQARERRQEAQGPDRPDPDHLLRGRGPRQARRLLHARRGAPGAARRLPHRAAHVLLECWLKCRRVRAAGRARALPDVCAGCWRSSRSCWWWPRVTFVLIHLAPGDPASVIAGPYATRGRHRAAPPPARASTSRCPCSSSHWYGRLPAGRPRRLDLPAPPGHRGHPGAARADPAADELGHPDRGAHRRARRHRLGALPQHRGGPVVHGAGPGRPLHPQLPARAPDDPRLRGLAALAAGGRLRAARRRASGRTRARCSCRASRSGSCSRPSSRASPARACSTCCASSTSWPAAPRAWPSGRWSTSTRSRTRSSRPSP